MSKSHNNLAPIWDARDLAISLGLTTRQLNGLINTHDYPTNGRVPKNRGRVSRGKFGYVKPIFDEWWNQLQLSQKDIAPKGFDAWWTATGKKRGRRVALSAWVAALAQGQEEA